MKDLSANTDQRIGASKPPRKPLFSKGMLAALPLYVLLAFGFFGPMIMVLVYSFMPRGSFSLKHAPSFENYVDIVIQSFHISYGWSIILAFSSVVTLLLVCYPLAVALVRIQGKKAHLITILIVSPLFVAENIRLQGWVFFLDKGGFLDGSMSALFGIGTGSLVNNVPAIVFGIVYIYLPFMLFPMMLGLNIVPKSAREAAFDLGASRWQILKDIELPLAMPGILIGSLLCFVLSLGAFTESKFLGKGVIVTVAQDIESAFTFGQNWPRGSALSVIVIIIAASAVFFSMRRVNLDRMLGKR